MIDTLRGIAIIVFIAALAGAIAYVGDRVGHQVGRKRLTLFGIRPRYTSTIVAIGTGVVIALVLTLGAIFASNEVKLAFFKLYSINQQIQTLQTQESALEEKVNNAQIVVPKDRSIVPQFGYFPKGSTPATRERIVSAFYAYTVSYIQRALVPPLRPFEKPNDLDALINQLATARPVDEANQKSGVFLVATADHNLFAGDRADFAVHTFVDGLIMPKGQQIGQITVPAGTSDSIGVAYSLLQQGVANTLLRRGMPPYFIGTPTGLVWLPLPDEMQKTVANGSGTYVMTAFADEDIYLHTAIDNAQFIIPIVVTLSRQP